MPSILGGKGDKEGWKQIKIGGKLTRSWTCIRLSIIELVQCAWGEIGVRYLGRIFGSVIWCASLLEVGWQNETPFNHFSVCSWVHSEGMSGMQLPTELLRPLCMTTYLLLPSLCSHELPPSNLTTIPDHEDVYSNSEVGWRWWCFGK